MAASPPNATVPTPAGGRTLRAFRGNTTRPIIWLFAVGGAAATVSLIVGPASMDRTQIAGICGAAWGLAVILCFAPERLPRWAVHVFLAAGTLLVEWITLASGDSASPYPLLYFWVATCAFCFLSRIEATAQAALIVIAYAAGLVLTPGTDSMAGFRWALFAAALAVGGAFIGMLRVKHDKLMVELQSISRTDPVTRLLDERGFDEAMANELERASRSGGRFGVIVTAIDGWETIPAPHRTPLLTAAAEVVVEAKRNIDSAARLDGDEFVVIATYTDERGAAVLAERIRSAARDAFEGRATMSIGVVSHPRHGATAEILMNAAREARTEATRLGGDRSLVAASSADSIAARVRDADVQVVPLS